MGTGSDRRDEQRLRYNWPIWFAENFNGDLSQGQMTDVSSHAAAFTCYTHERCPYQGQWITARFSVPRYGPDGSFDMADFIRSGHVHRVDNIHGRLRRIALRFTQPLPFQPGEQDPNAALAASPDEFEPALA